MLRDGLQSLDKNPIKAKIANDNLKAITPFSRVFLPQIFQTLLTESLESSHAAGLSGLACAFICSLPPTCPYHVSLILDSNMS